MNAYLLSILGTVLLSTILTAILPNGKTTQLIRMITRLVCILAIISPILSFFKTGSLSLEKEVFSDFFSDSVIEEEASFIEYYSQLRIRETEDALERELFEKYAVEGEVTLTYERVEDKIRITQMCVVLQEMQEEEVLQSMWEYLTKKYCKEVLIE